MIQYAKLTIKELDKFTVYLIKRLFTGIRHHWILSLQFFFWQSFHAVSDALLRAKRYHTEALGSSIGTILKEFDLNKIWYAHSLYCIGYVLITCPLDEIQVERMLKNLFHLSKFL